jgi:hypothetical protein
LRRTGIEVLNKKRERREKLGMKKEKRNVKKRVYIKKIKNNKRDVRKIGGNAASTVVNN